MLKLPAAKSQGRRWPVRCCSYGKLGKSRSNSSVKSASSPDGVGAGSYQFRGISAKASSCVNHGPDLTSEGLSQFSQEAANWLARLSYTGACSG